MFDSTGDSGPPCGVPSSVTLTRPSSKTPAFRNARTSLSTRVSRTYWGEPPHQEIVIDSIEKLLQIEVHDPSIAARKVRLRRRHRLMC